jgi:hypothetical protein
MLILLSFACDKIQIQIQYKYKKTNVVEYAVRTLHALGAPARQCPNRGIGRYSALRCAVGIIELRVSRRGCNCTEPLCMQL